MSIVLVAFDPAPRTDPKCKSEDEKAEEVLFERAKSKLLFQPVIYLLKVFFAVSYRRRFIFLDDRYSSQSLLQVKTGHFFADLVV